MKKNSKKRILMNTQIIFSMRTRTVLMLLMAIAAFVGPLTTVQAQETTEKFTLTNGRLWWFDGSEGDSDAEWINGTGGRKIPVALDSAVFDAYGNPVNCYISGDPLNEITHITEQGDVYLALDTSDHDPAQAKVMAKPVSAGFSPNCAWSRTGATGYYYQEWVNPADDKSYRSYLIGTKGGLEIYTIEVGAPNEKNSLWFNWDFGAAITNVSYANGVRKETNHWLYYDTVGVASGEPGAGVWKMSGDSYERPETEVYKNYAADPTAAQLNKNYYYSYKGGDGYWHAYGNGALFMPLTQINHGIVIDQASADPNYGLQGITLGQSTLRYDQTTTALINIARDGGGVLTVPVTPSYTEYVEEIKRRGINLNYRERTTETFGSNGVATTNTPLYYKNGKPIAGNVPPTSNPKELTFVEATYSLTPSARRFLEMKKGSGDYTTRPITTTTESETITLHCYSVPTSPTATLTAVVKYSFLDATTEYFVYDTVEEIINLDATLDKRDDIDPVNAPVVLGYVCGGGRMANVGWDAGETGATPTNDITGGNTKVTIHNSDSIQAIYGGNDIAGWVQGQATINIGSMQTVFDMPISYVYGGGCGYYSYSSAYDVSADTWASATTLTGSVGAGNYCFGNDDNSGKVYPWKYTLTGDPAVDEAHVIASGFGYTPYTASADFQHGEKGQDGSGTVPYIKSAHVVIGVTEATAGDAATAALHNDLLHLDTVFGGAENAFIGIDGTGTASTAITVDVHGGSIMALFGGNNYGGAIAQAAHVYTTVHNTKTTTQLNTENTYFTGYGRDFGIRHLYGGGNMVESAHAEVTILGGMTDTCFVGGNQASVVQPVGTINCRGDKFIYDNPSLAFTDPGNSDYVNLQTWSTLDPSDPSDHTAWHDGREKMLKTNPGAVITETGRYNVRVFFGGNNKADMNNLSYIHLASGGVEYVYGGGNQGDMLNTTAYNSPFYRRWAKPGYPLRTAADPSFDSAAWVADGWTKVLDFGDSVRGSLSGNGWIYEMPGAFGSMVNAPQHSAIFVENIYGGCRMANVKHSSGLSLSGGVFGYVQGGCDISGDVGSKVAGEGTWVIIDSNALVLQDVYGGSDGYYHCHDNSTGLYLEEDVYSYADVAADYYHEYVGLPTPTQNNSNLYINGGNILYSAYGGGVMCDIGYKEGNTYRYYRNGTPEALNPAEGSQNGSIHFLMNSGTVGSPYWHYNANLLDGNVNIAPADLATNRATAASADELANHDGNLYGGGYLSSLYGLSYFKIQGDSKVYGSVFSGNDCMGSVNHFGKYSTPAVPDPANFKASDGITELNGSSNANFSSYLLIEGTPRLACVYGGGNGAYNYHMPDRPEYSDFEPVCMEGAVDNRPVQKSAFIDIHTSGGYIDTVFGGGNGVGVDDNVHILFNVASLDAVADVGTIFGGNNRDDMTKCVPSIDLRKGVVDNVYGGGNAGSMKGGDDYEVNDVCGNPVQKISTYVLVQSEDVTILGSVFGGCRMADVTNMAYVDIRGTNDAGVQYVYGGNDIAGTVHGNTRVDVSGGTVHHIWGGSNGYYQYQTIDPREDENVYAFTDPTFAGTPVAMHTTGEPYVDSATVNLFGGEILESVYGGGRMGDVRATTVVVDNQACTERTLNITGAIYGGGEGDWANLDHPRRGNTGENTTGLASGLSATGATHVHLKSATHLSSATAYGGGRGGDAYNTYITTYPSWTQPFNAIYGGCWGSDVKGTTHVELNGVTQARETAVTSELYTARNVYGGNDFTGNVYASDITVNSGTYGNIYGAGDGFGGTGGEGEDDGTIAGIGSESGAYATDYSNNTYGSGLTVPNTEYININVNDCRLTGNLYGGGKLGTTFSYQKDAEGAYVLDGSGKKIADTSMTVATAYADPEKYSYIIVNVHGGVFDNNIFAGASGRIGGNALVYGLKVLNMDGGVVGTSLYGGSANVNDGYRNECIDKDNTTERPSSVINMTAGTIGHSVYGGGYKGVIRGSAYINVGADAIDKCELWDKTVKGRTNAYALFKPGATDGHVPAMAELVSTNPLTINQSIYAGPNWGNSSGLADFSNPGVYGGETRIFVDGNNYNTGSDDLKPVMYIIGSIIGAGTSAAGGDVYSRIDMRNYGEVGDNCRPTRELKAIQRAHGLWLYNTAIEYTGSTDAINAYLSNQITLNRLDTLNTVGYNVIDVDYAITNIGEVNYYKKKDYPYYSPDLAENVNLNRGSGTNVCDEDLPEYICNQLGILDRTTNPYTALIVNDGINIDFIKPSGEYSEIHGFAYLLAPKNSSAVVTAAPKYASTNTGNGGFLTVCQDSLKVIVDANGYLLEWGAPNATQLTNEAEYPYFNYSSQYRVWSLGNGTRRRFAVVQAHSNPDKALADNKKITLEGKDNNVATDYNLAIAHSTLTLPPTKPGHYYKINVKGVDLTDENEEMRLVDQSYLPVTWADTLPNGDPMPNRLDNEWHITGATSAAHNDSQVEPAAHGTIKELASATGHEGVTKMGIDAIYKNSNTYFGLMMVSGANFATDPITGKLVPPAEFATNANWYGGTTISGNSHVNITQDFSTAKVGANENVSPELDLYMLYDNRFSHTMLGTVSLQLDEYDETGHIIQNKPIEVEITLSTVLEEFTDMEYEVLAMYNEGRSNIFERKVVLPATLQTRELYLKGITWAPTDNNGNWLSTASNPQTFYMTDKEAQITGDNVYAANRFGMELYVTDNVSNTLTTSVGWYTQEMTYDKKKNLYTLAGYTATDKKRVTGTDENAYYEGGVSDTIFDQPITSALSVYGEPLGTLDGRGEAAVVVRLNFDGSRIYPKTEGKGYVGKVVMHLVSYNTESAHNSEDANEFDLTVYVKTRAHGDTIYLATAQNAITRNGITMHSHSSGTDGTNSRPTDLTTECGKHPNDYLHTFQEAFTGPYQEGDVIAILDTVIIGDNTQVFIKGEEYMPVQVIRYSGHHHAFPGEGCAYRGTMIRVDGTNASFAARCIDFNGSMLTKTKPKIVGTPWDNDFANINNWIANHPTDTWDGLSITDWVANHPNLLTDFKIENNSVVGSYDKFADTLKAYGPILAAKNGTINLQNGTTVEHNYNIYDGADHSLMGAISVTGGSTLQLINNVTIKENLSKKLTGDTKEHPLNGAVYVDGGSVWLQTPTSATTAITATKNLQVETENGDFFDLDNINIKGLADAQNVHYSFQESAIYNGAGELTNNNFSLANIYLTRTEKTNNLTDLKTDLIYLSSLPNAGTKIGISKWFPGPTERDTIQVVFQSSATQLKEAVYTNKNFSSDDGYNIFYNYGVNGTRAYLHRCATFNYQQGTGINDFVKYIESTPHTANFKSDRALDYHVLPDASCPTGGDTLLYRLQGGFFPYTYTWYDRNDGDAEYRTRTTTGTDLEINNQVKNGNFDGVRQAVVDSLVTPPVSIPYTATDGNYHYKVSASDVTGFCTLTKDVYVKLVKDISDNAVEPINFDYDGTYTEAKWSDNVTDADDKNPHNGTDAKGIRTYKAIKITPYVSPNSTYGNIIAAVGNEIYDNDVSGSGLQTLSFCEGDVIRLAAQPKSGKKFVMWDFSPYYNTPTTYVVPSASTDVIAYYSPNDYWIDVVNTPEVATAVYDNSYIYTSRPAGKGYVTTYHGDVHIYDENGLAWFISVVNGLNGTQARPFFFNNVFLHQKDGGYDMAAHKWTPVGTIQHRFRGGFIGVSNTETDTVPLTNGQYVSIKHLIVDEPNLNDVGMFAFLDSALVQSVKLEAALMRGSQNVGTLAANSVQTKIINCSVIDSLEGAATSTTLLTTRHTSGGMVAKADRTTINLSSTSAKYVGDAVYSGGMVGYATGSKIYNNYMRNLSRMSAVYQGGVVGYAESTTILPQSRFGSKSGDNDGRTYIKNNYVHSIDQGRTQRVGGLVGYAKNSVIENNYVYGNMTGESTEGGVGAVLDDGTQATHNYYENKAVGCAVGQTRSGAVTAHNEGFSGSGNQVTLSQADYGVDNLTRVLNIWVRTNGGDFSTWRSDLNGTNNGYPVFGSPDMIPVADSLTVTGCDSVEWDGVTYLFDDEVVSHVVDSVMMVDSTFTLRIMVNHASREQVEDSVNVGYGYTGHGFELTETEVLMLYRTVGRSHSTTIVLTDTLQSAAGCDSIVTLMLTINERLEIEEPTVQNQIRVFPNPTTARVTVESSEAMSHVELFDNRGRRLQNYNTYNTNETTIDVSQYPTGAYYLRVYTAGNVTIQKLIKK